MTVGAPLAIDDHVRAAGERRAVAVRRGHDRNVVRHDDRLRAARIRQRQAPLPLLAADTVALVIDDGLRVVTDLTVALVIVVPGGPFIG